MQDTATLTKSYMVDICATAPPFVRSTPKGYITRACLTSKNGCRSKLFVVYIKNKQQDITYKQSGPSGELYTIQVAAVLPVSFCPTELQSPTKLQPLSQPYRGALGALLNKSGLGSAEVWGNILSSDFHKRLAQKLRRIILLHFGLVLSTFSSPNPESLHLHGFRT